MDSVYQIRWMKKFERCDRKADTGNYIIMEPREAEGGDEHVGHD